MEPIVVNGNIHTAHKQHQSLCVLREWDLKVFNGIWCWCSSAVTQHTQASYPKFVLHVWVLGHEVQSPSQRRGRRLGPSTEKIIHQLMRSESKYNQLEFYAARLCVERST